MSGTTFFAEHFGLAERPFTLLPDPDFLYWTRAHKRAFAMLEYGLMSRAPITVVTGEVGAGKTTLLQKLLRTVGDDTTVGLISNAQGGRGDLLAWVLAALSIEARPGADYVAKFQDLQDFILEEYASGRHVLLVIDEAQNLSIEGLEELRMLTNINSGKDELLQLVLMGQPELRDTISRPELRQFAQRVSANYHIPAMDREATHAYVRHRLRHAGGTGEEFTPEAVDIVHEQSGGVPRLVNKLCDFAMVYALTNDVRTIDVGIVGEVVGDSLFIVTQEEDEGPAPAEATTAPGETEGAPRRTPSASAGTAPAPAATSRPSETATRPSMATPRPSTTTPPAPDRSVRFVPAPDPAAPAATRAPAPTPGPDPTRTATPAPASAPAPESPTPLRAPSPPTPLRPGAAGIVPSRGRAQLTSRLGGAPRPPRTGGWSHKETDE